MDKVVKVLVYFICEIGRAFMFISKRTLEERKIVPKRALALSPLARATSAFL